MYSEKQQKDQTQQCISLSQYVSETLRFCTEDANLLKQVTDLPFNVLKNAL